MDAIDLAARLTSFGVWVVLAMNGIYERFSLIKMTVYLFRFQVIKTFLLLMRVINTGLIIGFTIPAR